MKKIFLLSFLFYSLLVSSQNEYFYYYNNTKQYLNLNSKYAYISGPYANIQLLLSNNSNSIESVDTLNNENGYVVIEFLDSLPKERYLSKLKEFIRNYNVYAEPYFSNNSFDKIGNKRDNNNGFARQGV